MTYLSCFDTLHQKPLVRQDRTSEYKSIAGSVPISLRIHLHSFGREVSQSGHSPFMLDALCMREKYWRRRMRMDDGPVGAGLILTMLQSCH